MKRDCVCAKEPLRPIGTIYDWIYLPDRNATSSDLAAKLHRFIVVGHSRVQCSNCGGAADAERTETLNIKQKRRDSWPIVNGEIVADWKALVKWGIEQMPDFSDEPWIYPETNKEGKAR